MSDTLSPGDRVRVKPLWKYGTITHVSTTQRRYPYLVALDGGGDWTGSASDLARLDPTPPCRAAPSSVLAVVGPTNAYVCGVHGCWREINPRSPTCTKCGTPWRLP